MAQYVCSDQWIFEQKNTRFQSIESLLAHDRLGSMFQSFKSTFLHSNLSIDEWLTSQRLGALNRYSICWFRPCLGSQGIYWPNAQGPLSRLLYSTLYSGPPFHIWAMYALFVSRIQWIFSHRVHMLPGTFWGKSWPTRYGWIDSRPTGSSTGACGAGLHDLELTNGKVWSRRPCTVTFTLLSCSVAGLPKNTLLLAYSPSQIYDILPSWPSGIAGRGKCRTQHYAVWIQHHAAKAGVLCWR